MKLALSATIAALCLLVPSISTAATYTYTGPNFTTFVNDPPYDATDHLAITLDLNSVLLPNLSNADVSGDVHSWALSVGGNSYGSAGGDTISSLTFSTNASGEITGWYSYLVGGGTFGFISSSDTGDSAFDFVAHGSAWNASTSSIGSWTEAPPTSTPEPSAISLMLLSCGAAFFVFRAKKENGRSS